jgi:DNA-binding LacI/PurR family transcriptional regulator
MVIATGDRLDGDDVRASLHRLAESVPLVVIGQHLEDATWTTVQFDDVAASADAVRELLRARPRPLLFIGTNDRSFLAEQRREGAARALGEHPSLVADSRFLGLEARMDFHAGYEAAMAVADGLRGFGSVFCVNDELALGVCRAAGELDVAVPQHLMVLGYADIDLLPYVTPSLSSVSGDVSSVARDVIESLLAQFGGDRTAHLHTHERRIVHRESTFGPSAATGRHPAPHLRH